MRGFMKLKSNKVITLPIEKSQKKMIMVLRPLFAAVFVVRRRYFIVAPRLL